MYVFFGELTEWIKYKMAFKHTQRTPNSTFTKVSNFTGAEGWECCRALKFFPCSASSNHGLQFASQIKSNNIKS